MWKKKRKTNVHQVRTANRTQIEQCNVLVANSGFAFFKAMYCRKFVVLHSFCSLFSSSSSSSLLFFFVALVEFASSFASIRYMHSGFINSFGNKYFVIMTLMPLFYTMMRFFAACFRNFRIYFVCIIQYKYIIKPSTRSSLSKHIHSLTCNYE